MSNRQSHPDADVDSQEMRACCICGRNITACFGFTLVRDLLAYWEGKPIEKLRELCGLCVELYVPDAGEPQNWRRYTEEEMIEKGFIPIPKETE